MLHGVPGPSLEVGRAAREGAGHGGRHARLPRAPRWRRETRLDGFVSYSRRDATTVLPLIEEAERRGRSLWLDADDIPAGTPWREELGSGIEAADSFLACLSDHWLASTECRKEYDQAVDLGKRLVPVVVGELDTGAVPAPLAVLQWVAGARPRHSGDPRVGLLSHRRRPGAGPRAHALARARAALGAPRPGPLAARARAGAAVRGGLARPAGRQPRSDALADAVRHGQQERRARSPAQRCSRWRSRPCSSPRCSRSLRWCSAARRSPSARSPRSSGPRRSGSATPRRSRQLAVGGPRPDRCRPGASARSSPRRPGPPRPPTRRWRPCGRRSRRRTPGPRHHAHDESVVGAGLAGRPCRGVDRPRRAAPGVRRERRLEPRRGHARAWQAAVLRCDTGRRPRPGHVALGHRVGVASGRRRPTGADAGPDPPRRYGRGRLAERRRPGRRRWGRLGDRARRRPIQRGRPPPADAPTRRSRRPPRAAGSSPSAR